MKVEHLLENLRFNDDRPHAETLFNYETSKVIRFTLKPGQELKEHRAPRYKLNIIVLRGKGMFGGGGGQELSANPMTLLHFEVNELHRVKALGEELVFVAFLDEPKDHS